MINDTLKYFLPVYFEITGGRIIVRNLSCVNLLLCPCMTPKYSLNLIDCKRLAGGPYCTVCPRMAISSEVTILDTTLLYILCVYFILLGSHVVLRLDLALCHCPFCPSHLGVSSPVNITCWSLRPTLCNTSVKISLTFLYRCIYSEILLYFILHSLAL